MKTLFLLALLCVPFVVQAQETPPAARPEHRENHMNPMAMLTQRLHLTPEQQAQIKPILEQEHVKMQALRKQGTPDRAQFKALRQSFQAQIRAVLTPEQQAIFDQRPERKEKS